MLEHTGRLAETNEREQFEAGKMSEALQKMFQSMHPCVRLLIFFLLSLTMRLPRSCKQINPPYGEVGDEYMRLDYRLTITKGWKYVMTWKDFSINQAQPVSMPPHRSPTDLWDWVSAQNVKECGRSTSSR